MPSFIQQNVPLAPLTTLGVGGTADYFAPIQTDDELRNAVEWARREELSIHILGGGANTLVRDTGVRGLVLHLINTSLEIEEQDTTVLVRAGAGVSLDSLIAYAVEHELWGIENLSHIPSTIGALPVQNVGAYGVEAKDVITEVVAYDMTRDVFQTFNTLACAFGYRHSFFKTEEGKNFIITRVTLALTRNGTPKLEYKDVLEYFGDTTTPTLEEIRNAIIVIRTKKLPDWKTVGTAGSFFKNPIITSNEYETLKTTYPELPGFSEGEGLVKIPLGWVLDHVCGLRGYRVGNVWLHAQQALVLVCEKGTSTNEIDTFIEMIKKSVQEKIGIEIEAEVRVME